MCVCVCVHCSPKSTAAAKSARSVVSSVRSAAISSPEAEVVESELIVWSSDFGFTLQQVWEKDGGVQVDAVVKSIRVDSPCAGLIGLGDQLVAINGYRVTCVLCWGDETTCFWLLRQSSV